MRHTLKKQRVIRYEVLWMWSQLKFGPFLKGVLSLIVRSADSDAAH